jgi:hypothetical protein
MGLQSRGPRDTDEYVENETRWNQDRSRVTRRKFRMVDWAKMPQVQQAWGEMVREHGLTQELRDIDRVFGTLCRPASLILSLDKSRKLFGWRGFVDSSEALLEVLQDLR